MWWIVWRYTSAPISFTSRLDHISQSFHYNGAGEGAAIGSGASILGFGSDIGGSVRIPAAWCGCYSLKPTALRLSFQGDVSTDLNERIGR